MAAFPYAEVPDEVQEIFERHDLSVNGWERSLGTYDFELEGSTDCGGDMIHSLHIKEDEVVSLKAWYKAFFDICEAFSPWDEAFTRCDRSGVPQNTPFSSGDDLYHDLSNYKDDVLEDTLDDLHLLAFGRRF